MGTKPIRPQTKSQNNLPDYERASFLKKRLAEGWENSEILDDYMQTFYGRSAGSGNLRHRRDAFRRLILVARKDPRRWDPDVDWVLVERAYMGDEQTWLDLSHYERRVCIEKLFHTYENALWHPRWPNLNAGHGIAEWERSVGEPHGRIANAYHKRKAHERERQARSEDAA